MFASTQTSQEVLAIAPADAPGRPGPQVPPPRLLLNQHLQIRTLNAYLLQLCSIDTDACRGASIEEWVNADSALLARIKAGVAAVTAPWHEEFTLRLPGGTIVSALLKLTPLRGHTGPGLLVTMRDIRLSADLPGMLTA